MFIGEILERTKEKSLKIHKLLRNNYSFTFGLFQFMFDIS